MRKVILVVMDGWGIAPPGPGNYISQAKIPRFNYLVKNYPHTKNKASGEAVGLPKGAQGNSEVGHLHMGAGRIVLQMYELINRAIKDKTLPKNKTLAKAMDFAKKNNSSLHLVGLCSDEGVHAHTNHLIALLKMAKKRNVKKVFIHFIADGRDVPEKSAKEYLKIIEMETRKLKLGKIATVAGRYYSMDRDNNWNRTKEAYDLLTLGKGFKAKNATEAVNQAYKKGDKTDYYIHPTIIVDKNQKPISLIKDKDSVIFFNFRTDRPRQLTKAFISKKFTKFKRKVCPKVLFTAMTEYDKTFNCPFAFERKKIKNNLGQVLEKRGLKQLRVAETEKYAHVTYFFNSQVEKPNKGEDHLLIPSPKVISYDKKPEMSAREIMKKTVKQIKKQKYDFILLNFANCDLVGHSAVKKAIIKAVEVVELCTEKIVEAGLENEYTLILTADHGSAEDKLYPDGKPKPSHSTNLVPFIVVSADKKVQKIKLKSGGQKDVAPTILELMGIKKPKEMKGKSLIVY
ncbi:MAG: 2,3-bisphosphoglycerate-independent phosphoglycerate mutase [Candidatus Aenigmarchaeota archaeon]|nr:2,3-bisphosphoglycerate-independent phosphoglycerate mutase [Candidatus Aenigmarchaeota archaeon]